MHTVSFLSKLTRVTTAHHHHLLKLSSNYTHSYAPVQPRQTAYPMPNHACCCRQFHFPCISRYLSSLPPTSSSGSDDGKHGDKSNNTPISIKKAADESQSEPEGSLPSPACASLHNFVTRPLVEDKVVLEASRKGRPNKTPETLPKPTPRKEQSKPRRDKSHNDKPTDPTPGRPSPSPSRKRAKDRLEELSKQDADRRLVFAYKLFLLLEDEPDILDHILWTDECNFNLPKLPSLIKKPPVAESELLPQIAWCGISTKGTVGPYFFNSHVTGGALIHKNVHALENKTYVKMLETYLLPELEQKGYNLKELWFQQDGAPWHRSKTVLDFLKSVFDFRLISLGTKFIWPPRSQDLTPMDYFFWDYMKVKLDFKHSKYDLCFQHSFRDILTREVSTASVNALQGAIYQLPERLEMCMNENGGRFVHLLYPDRYEKDGTRKARRPPQEGHARKSTKAIKEKAASNLHKERSDTNNVEQLPGVSTSSSPLPPVKPEVGGSSANTNVNTTQ